MALSCDQAQAGPLVFSIAMESSVFVVNSPFRGADLWKPTWPELFWLYAAYGQIGEVPPVAHRHHISLEHRRNRSFYPTQRSRGGGSFAQPSRILPPTPADVLFPRHRKRDNEEGVDVGAFGC